MREILTGQVTEGLLAALFGLISREELCGVLRVSQGTTINTVFFEIGVPIFAVGAEVTELSQESPGESNVLPPSGQSLKRSRYCRAKSRSVTRRCPGVCGIASAHLCDQNRVRYVLALYLRIPHRYAASSRSLSCRIE